MNQPIDEQLSALMDGEVARDQLRFMLKRMDADHSLPVRWERYHIARQALRRQEIKPLSTGFADAVMARLEGDEVVVETRQPAAWLRWGTGGAIAASVAVAALVLTRPTGDPATFTPSGSVAARNTPTQAAPVGLSGSAPTTTVAAALPGNFRPPLLAPNVPVETAPVSFGSDLSQPIGFDPRLQSYVSRHYQTVGPNGQSAVVPYVLMSRPQRAESEAAEAAGQNR